MANGGLGLPIIRTHAKPLLRDLWHFALRPRMPDARLAPGRDFAVVFLLLLLIDLALAVASEGVLWTAELLGYEQPELFDLDVSLPVEWLLLAVLAPATEEPLFRGFLSGTKAALAFMFRAVIGLALIFAGAALYDQGYDRPIGLGLWIIGAAIVFGGFVRWLQKRRSQTSVPPWFERSFHWFVWSSALAFGLVHLMNYEGALSPWDGVMVLSQTAGGLILAYTRTRLGLRAAIAQHACFNSIVTVL